MVVKMIITVISAVILGCTNYNSEDFNGDDIRLFRNTPIWEVAKYVEKENTTGVVQFFEKHPDLINLQEPKFQMTLLYWSVQNEKFHSAQALIEHGANPNIKNNLGITALNQLANHKNVAELLQLFIKYGGDVNAVSEHGHLKTPLITAVHTSFENTKILVEAGANINYIDPEYHECVLRSALDFSNIDIVKDLIMEKGADFTMKLGVAADANGNPGKGDTIYIINLFRFLTFPLNSREHNVKMEIVNYMKERGVDYWSTKIPKHYHGLFDDYYLSKY
jgi:ankyrin repeat protein